MSQYQGYGGQALQDQQSSNQQTQLQGNLAGGQAVNVAGSGLSVAELLAQIGAIDPELGVQGAQAQQGLGYAEDNAWIGQQQLGLQGQGLQAQAGLLNTQYGIQQKTLAGQEKLSATQYGLSQQDLAAQEAQQKLGYANQVAGTSDQLAASGALNTKGSQRTQNTQSTENQMAQQQLQRTGIGEKAAYQYQQQQYGLEQQGEAAQQAYSLGDIARGESGLNLASEQNGLGLQQTINQTNYGMQQAGYAAQQSADQLYGQVGQAIGQGDTYQAGAIGYGALLGGVNLNSALAGGG